VWDDLGMDKRPDPFPVVRWYEHSDGTVGLYTWGAPGAPAQLRRTVASWADVPAYDAHMGRYLAA